MEKTNLLHGLQVIDRILYKLDELVRPFVHKILVVIEPLLIDEDYYARVEGREIIANLSKVRFFCSGISQCHPRTTTYIVGSLDLGLEQCCCVCLMDVLQTGKILYSWLSPHCVPL